MSKVPRYKFDLSNIIPDPYCNEELVKTKLMHSYNLSLTLLIIINNESDICPKLITTNIMSKYLKSDQNYARHYLEELYRLKILKRKPMARSKLLIYSLNKDFTKLNEIVEIAKECTDIKEQQ